MFCCLLFIDSTLLYLLKWALTILDHPLSPHKKKEIEQCINMSQLQVPEGATTGGALCITVEQVKFCLDKKLPDDEGKPSNTYQELCQTHIRLPSSLQEEVLGSVDTLQQLTQVRQGLDLSLYLVLGVVTQLLLLHSG